MSMRMIGALTASILVWASSGAIAYGDPDCHGVERYSRNIPFWDKLNTFEKLDQAQCQVYPYGTKWPVELLAQEGPGILVDVLTYLKGSRTNGDRGIAIATICAIIKKNGKENITGEIIGAVSEHVVKISQNHIYLPSLNCLEYLKKNYENAKRKRE